MEISEIVLRIKSGELSFDTDIEGARGFYDLAAQLADYDSQRDEIFKVMWDMYKNLTNGQ